MAQVNELGENRIEAGVRPEAGSVGGDVVEGEPPGKFDGDEPLFDVDGVDG